MDWEEVTSHIVEMVMATHDHKPDIIQNYTPGIVKEVSKRRTSYIKELRVSASSTGRPAVGRAPAAGRRTATAARERASERALDRWRPVGTTSRRTTPS